MCRWWIGLAVVGLTWGAVLVASSDMPQPPVQPSPDSTAAIYVVRHGWHAGVAVPRAAFGEEGGPFEGRFSGARYIEVGWGDAGYYPGDQGWDRLLIAGLWPTSSVVHAVPIRTSVTRRFAEQTIVRIPVASGEMDAVAQFVRASLELEAGQPVAAADGYYADSQFFASPLDYHGANNCNHWAAFALRAAGCDVAPRRTFTVKQVLRAAARCGTRLTAP